MYIYIHILPAIHTIASNPYRLMLVSAIVASPLFVSATGLCRCWSLFLAREAPRRPGFVWMPGLVGDLCGPPGDRRGMAWTTFFNKIGFLYCKN